MNYSPQQPYNMQNNFNPNMPYNNQMNPMNQLMQQKQIPAAHSNVPPTQPNLNQNFQIDNKNTYNFKQANTQYAPQAQQPLPQQAVINIFI
jgi:hypothetical protein